MAGRFAAELPRRYFHHGVLLRHREMAGKVSKTEKPSSLGKLLADMKLQLLDDSVPVSSILRMALVLSYENEDLNLREWVNAEIDGYKEGVEVPDYRHGHCQSFGNFVGPGYAYMNSMPLPPYFIPQKYHSVTNELLFRENFRTLEVALLSALKDGGYARCNWPADLIALLSDKFYQRFRLVAAWVLVQPSDILEVVETVRNRLLRYVLEIDPSYVSNDEKGIKRGKERMATVFNTTILGNVSGLNQNCENVDQTLINELKSIPSGDWPALSRFIDKIGSIAQNDKDDLKNAIDEDKKVGSVGVGLNANKWIDRIRSGSIKFATSLSMNVVANLITQAIVAFNA